MKNIKLVSILLLTATLAFTLPAQANEPPKTGFAGALDTFKDWLKDNTNFWGQQTAIVDVSGLYSHGKESGSSGDAKNTYGAALDLRFPLDDQGQVTIGIWAAYFNESFFAGSLTSTLGKTVHIPVINTDLFLFAGGGPGANLAQPDALIGVAYTGAVWKHNLTGGDKPLTLFVSGAVAKVTSWDGNVALLTVGIGKKF